MPRSKPATQRARDRGPRAAMSSDASQHRDVLVDRRTAGIPVGPEHRQATAPSTAGTVANAPSRRFRGAQDAGITYLDHTDQRAGDLGRGPHRAGVNRVTDQLGAPVVRHPSAADLRSPLYAIQRENRSSTSAPARHGAVSSPVDLSRGFPGPAGAPISDRPLRQHDADPLAELPKGRHPLAADADAIPRVNPPSRPGVDVTRGPGRS